MYNIYKIDQFGQEESIASAESLDEARRLVDSALEYYKQYRGPEYTYDVRREDG
jgi:hypothetical protein